MSGSEVRALGAEAMLGPASLSGRGWVWATALGTYGLALLQHGEHEENVAVAGL